MLSVKSLYTEYREPRAAPSVKAAQDVSFDVPDGELFTLLGPERLRQDHDAALDRRAGAAALRRDRGRRPRGLFLGQRHFRRAEPAQFRHGVPVLRHLAAHERVPERGVPARSAQSAAEPQGDRAKGHAGAGDRAARPTWSTARRPSSPAASSSGWRWRARWSWSRSSCCSTSRCRTSTPSCARRCASN